MVDRTKQSAGSESVIFIKEESLKGKEHAAVTGKIILKGKLRLTSPLIIGGGESLFADSDIVVLKDEKGKPYIPSSSLTGVLKHNFADYQHKTAEDDNNYRLNRLWFWGGEYFSTEEPLKRFSSQSAMLIDDLTLEKDCDFQITVRDGIKIDPKTGMTADGNKFDYEIVEPGACFNFDLEVTLRKAYSPVLFNSFVQWIVNCLTSESFAIGARTAQGYGRCKLEEPHLYEFDYKKKGHAIAWLKGDLDKARVADLKAADDDFVYSNRPFSIAADFRICNSLIVGAYSGEPAAPDKVHLKSRSHDGNETAVLPGTSLRGAVRARAERIVNTLGSNGEELLKPLFGWVDNRKGLKDEDKEKPIKSRVIIEEKPITRGTYAEEIQHRIRIDRFTGGVMNAALFDSMPLWTQEGQESMVKLEITIRNYDDWEAGLLLLVLKDLWNSDLAVGGEKNIGRGTLQGQRAEISFSGQKFIMAQNERELLLYKEENQPAWDEQTALELEKFVADLLIKTEQYQQQGSEVEDSGE